MKKTLALIALSFALSTAFSAVPEHRPWRPRGEGKMTFTADRVAVDNVTRAALATGHVHAAVGVVTIRGEKMERDANGLAVFHNPSYVTTCSNELGHTHWNVTGEVRYQSGDYVLLRDVWLHFYEVPIFYLPYLYYPLDTACGFSWMPGYTGRWGAFLLTKYRYDILGDREHRENTWWLKGDTCFDLRYKNGIAVGEDLDWNLGDFGRGDFRIYYAWDKDADDRYGSGRRKYTNWASDVDEDRYGMSFAHRWNVTERDTVNARAAYYSDTYFRHDFMRKKFFELKSQWISYPNSGVTWEHAENAWSFGAEASGRLNDFYAMTERLPEFYLDVNPTPVFSLPVNYESANRAGWLDRRYAEYAAGKASPFGADPGLWCDYEAFRLDTYHRLTAPFRTFDDVLSVVPRLGYRGTLWSESGLSDYRGESPARECGQLYRSIVESGVTFAARGTAWVDETWSHMAEPYLDVLAQEACFSGRDSGARPYVFDNLDASMAWEDQFAGRGRNLPYSYYGVTPGLRNAWSALDEKGNLRQVVDLDVYAAVSFGSTSFDGERDYGDYDMHKLAEPGKPNYGKHAGAVAPGARIRWTPDDDITLMARAEYDSDYNAIAIADLGWQQTVTKTFRYSAAYCLRDARYWDFSSPRYEASEMKEDALGDVRIHMGRLACEYQPLDWLAVGPYVRWDFEEGEVDSIGTWVDYLTDCLGFRFLVEYDNSYERIDGYEHSDDWTFGFYIYLRAFGSNAGAIFGDR